MNCKAVQDLLSAYIDCELAAEESALLQEHLGLCANCREEECQMRLLKLLIASAPCAEPPPGFEHRLFQNVLEHPAEAAMQAVPTRDTVIAFSGVVLMAASLTMLVLNFVATPATTPDREAAFAFEVRRDQATLTTADPFGSSPPVVPNHYVGR